MLEAMASGLPALTTSFIGLPAPGEELGHPGQHFLLLEREADVWSRTVVDMLLPPRPPDVWRWARPRAPGLGGHQPPGTDT